jgi:hypothetical protein
VDVKSPDFDPGVIIDAIHDMNAPADQVELALRCVSDDPTLRPTIVELANEYVQVIGI